jgi:chemotaxis protein MotB
MKAHVFLIFFAAGALSLSSCVSQKKYVDEFARRQAAEDRETRLQNELRILNEQLEANNKNIIYKEGQIKSLTQEAERLHARNENLQNELNRIINEATSQQERMDMAMQARAQELSEKEKLINELQGAIEQRDAAMNAILGQIEGALKQYTADELSIEMRDGKVYVALSDRLLFQSGSANVERTGREAIGALAGALSRNPDISILVEGHTDNVPIRTNCFRDNWDLSVARATSVVRMLTADFGLSPQQVTAAGRGEFVPKAPNDTREGRALNRRTEIIIQPRLDEIYGVIRSKQ